MGMKANQALNVNKLDMLVSLRYLAAVTKGTKPFWMHPLITVGLVTAFIVAALYWFFGTELGASIRATGANINMARTQGINTDANKMIGLMLANGLVALSGSLFAQYNGNAEINMGRGAIVIGLAAIIIGDVLFGKLFKKKNRKVETSLIEEFAYPKLGPGQLWELMAERIQEMGGEIHMNCSINSFELSDDEKTIKKALASDGTEYAGDVFFSSMPVKDLIEGIENAPDEVRKVAKALGLPDSIAYRQPFPGPGLGVRCIGELTKAKLDILRDVDAIFRKAIVDNGFEGQASQYFAVLTANRSVGVTNDARTYAYTVALRAVKTTDFMTAKFVKLPMDMLEKVSEEITNTIPEVNRVVYDITSKPPATIEWE